MRDKRGFSLIELLVVIAIIAILAAILFPIFIGARKNAKKAQCTSNMKQIYSALSMYADDNNGFMPWNPQPASGTDWSTQTFGFACLYNYCKKTQIFYCPLAKLNPPPGTPENIYYIKRENGQILKGSYHFWPHAYRVYKDPAVDPTPPLPGRLDADPSDRSLVLWKDYGEKGGSGLEIFNKCVKLRGPLVDNFLHKLDDVAGYRPGALMLSLRGDVRFLPADAYPWAP